MSLDTNASVKLISHLGQFRHGKWDDEIYQRTKLCLLDSLACCSVGLSLPRFAQSATGMRTLFFGLGEQVRFSPFLMAYLYGQAANTLDYDDTLHGHPGAPIIGAVLAIAASRGLSMDRLLRGIAAGYEAHGVLCQAASPSQERASIIRSVSVWDTVAASIGASIALDLEDDMIKHVIGVALTHSVLPYTGKWYERPVPALKNNMGWIAAGAVLSINLALAGQRGITAPLEGDTGMWRMAGSDRWVFDEQTLNMRPAVLRVGFKHYPACWHTQEYLKTLASLLPKLDPGDGVAQIVVFGPPDVEKFCPKGLLGTADIAFSLPALFALMIRGVEPGPRWESMSQADAPYDFQYQAAEQKSILIRMRKGQEVSANVEAMKSEGPLDLAKSGLDRKGVVAKFNRLADPNLRSKVHSALLTEDSLSLEKIPEALYCCITQLVTKSL